jgi:hypothetical protein
MHGSDLGRLRGHEVLVAGMFSGTASQRRSSEDLVTRFKDAGVTTRLFDLAAPFGRPTAVAVPNAYLAHDLADIAATEIIIVAEPKLTGMAAKMLRGTASPRPRMIAFWDGHLAGEDAAMQQASSLLDAIWTPTSRLANIVLASLPNYSGEIDIVHHRAVITMETLEDRAAVRSRLNLPPAAFVVGMELTVDHQLAGQNPAGAIGAFRLAFDDDHNSWLVLHCELPDGRTPQYRALVQAAEHPRILVFDTLCHFVPRPGVMRAADVWLSLPCDEADRSAVDDALAAGLQVIACACGLSPAQWSHPALHPVRFTRSAAGDGDPDWVMPDSGHAARVLQALRASNRRQTTPFGEIEFQDGSQCWINPL